MKEHFRAFLPHAVAVVLFIVLAYSYFPALFEGKVLNQSDIVLWQGGANEIIQYREATGQEPLWTNSMFSGMPANMVSTVYKGNYLESVYHWLFVGERPASYMIVALVSFYLLMLACGAGPWLAVVGAVAFGLCSYNFQILQAGHNSKMVAIAFMPLVLAAAVYAFRKKAALGAVLFGIALCFEILAGHVQITYYLGFVLLAYLIGRLVKAVREKTLPRYGKVVGLLALAGALGVAANVNYLWPNWEYSKYTMRGGSELTLGDHRESDARGLKSDYATAWSYGIDETLNLLIPDYKGGSSSAKAEEGTATYEALRRQGVDPAQVPVPLYWGDQPFTAGPMYLGAVMVFLFVLGLYLVKGPVKWALAAVSLLAVMLGWGSHFMGLSEFFLRYVPLYNKFRTVSMTLVILQLTVPLLGICAVCRLLGGTVGKDKAVRGLKIALGVTGGICLLAALVPSVAGNFVSEADARYPAWLTDALASDRRSLLRADAFRSLVFVLLAGGTLWLAAAGKLRAKYAVPVLGLLVLFDMWPVDKRYLNDSHFVTPRQYRNTFAARPVDTAIRQDTTHYRVLDYTVNTFNDALVSYHHKNIGGYSAAKLQRYQDLIDYRIVPEMQAFVRTLQTRPAWGAVDSALQRQPVLNMLNTKYLVVDPEGAPLENPHALGNVWFVDRYRLVEDPDAEITALSDFDPASEVIVDRRFAGLLEGKTFAPDSAASIELVTYQPNRLEYKYRSASDRIGVFSEVYYPKGWKAYIDGREAPVFRGNFVLRAMVLPAGEHTVSFRYHPESYYKGGTVSRIASGLLLLLLIGTVAADLYRHAARRKEADKRA